MDQVAPIASQSSSVQQPQALQLPSLTAGNGTFSQLPQPPHTYTIGVLAGDYLHIICPSPCIFIQEQLHAG